MRIALDYDGTFTLSPKTWLDFIALAQVEGHDIRIVTVRDDRYDRTAPLRELEQNAPIIYTRGVAKRWFVTHFGDGFVPDIWIDDKPESILENSNAAPDWLANWRIEREELV